jgi:hypothetical protein
MWRSLTTVDPSSATYRLALSHLRINRSGKEAVVAAEKALLAWKIPKEFLA